MSYKATKPGLVYLSYLSMLYLGQLPKVDLIILEGEKCPYVRPQKVSLI